MTSSISNEPLDLDSVPEVGIGLEHYFRGKFSFTDKMKSEFVAELFSKFEPVFWELARINKSLEDRLISVDVSGISERQNAFIHEENERLESGNDSVKFSVSEVHHLRRLMKIIEQVFLGRIEVQSWFPK